MCSTCGENPRRTFPSDRIASQCRDCQISSLRKSAGYGGRTERIANNICEKCHERPRRGTDTWCKECISEYRRQDYAKKRVSETGKPPRDWDEILRVKALGLCSKCKKNPRAKAGSWCNQCRRHQSKIWRRTENGVKRIRNIAIRKKFGQEGLDQVISLLEAQQNMCAICGRTPEDQAIQRNHKTQVKQLAVDHDHLTGEIRGLLCDKCNRGIGFLRDDPALIRKAADYLDRFK